MATFSNGSAESDPPRIRIDAEPGSRAASRRLGSAQSGRRFVTSAVLVILAIWGVLYLCFVKWRTGYRQRTAFASAALAAMVDPLARIVPPNIAPATWARTVQETHAMLDRLAGSGVLDMDQIMTLRADLLERVGHVRPETAMRQIVEIWSDIELKAGPAIGPVRPPLFKLATAIAPLTHMKPADLDSPTWHRTLTETRLMLVTVMASDELSDAQKDELAEAITLRVSQTQPDTALDELALLWKEMATRAPGAASTIPRPAFLPEPGAV
jgi:hypothetical protein